MDKTDLKTVIELRGVNVSYGRASSCALKDIDLKIAEGSRVAVIGPNGSGKTTLLRAVIGAAGYEGDVSLLGSDIRSLKRRDIAKRAALLTQLGDSSFAYTVRETVSLGMYASGRKNSDESDFLDDILERTGLTDLQDRAVYSLSGGQRQRVYLARTFAQQTPVLLLDEPMNFLDLKYQAELSRLLIEWSEGETAGPDGNYKNTLVGVYHDISLARRMSDILIFVKNGRVVFTGKTGDTDYKKMLNEVYDMDVYSYMKEMSGMWK